jgi:hypothetical protein
MITKEKVLDIIDEEFFLLIRHLNNNMVAQTGDNSEVEK